MRHRSLRLPCACKVEEIIVQVLNTCCGTCNSYHDVFYLFFLYYLWYRIEFAVRNTVEKQCSDSVQDLLPEASLGSGKPLPPLQM